QNINGSAATGPTHYWVACNGGYIFESVDFGYNWTPNKLADTPLYDIDFHDPMRGVAVGINLVFYTTDGGLSWTGVSHPSSLQNVTMLDSVNVLAAGGEGEMWKSGDGGATWAPLGPGCAGMETIWRFDTGPDGRIWAAGDNSILRVEPEWQVSAECATYTVADTIFGRNIVFSRLGWKYPDRKILLCGHYDSTNRATDPMVCAPGADDNGSGTSIVLECARVLSEVSLEKTVEFALFDGEENGLVGSVAFATAVDTDEVYEAVINLDMVGADYTGDGKIRLGAIQDTPDTVLVAELTLASDYFARLYTIDWYYRTRTDQPMTDDLAFKGVLDIPAVSLIESGYRDNPHYHNCTDLFQYLDMDYMHDVARIVIATAGKMAGLGAEPAADVVLHQNFPNPFFSTTVVVFEIPARSHVRLAIYDVAGRKVRVLEDGVMDAGIYPVLWDGLSAGGEKVSSGVYFLRLEAGGTERSIKIVRIH
ncbi:MAG TPA: M28 family peptidase, partial [Candidatus Krumholzibacterium sp.]|nr:M28 family peptidase [Candidatus Krumholzibacterium sp.]